MTASPLLTVGERHKEEVRVRVSWISVDAFFICSYHQIHTHMFYNMQVVVDFSAQWCGPCKKIAPEFTALAQRHENVYFGKIDVDENTETAEKYDIASMPSFLFFKDARLIHTIKGANMQDVSDSVEKLGGKGGGEKNRAKKAVKEDEDEDEDEEGDDAKRSRKKAKKERKDKKEKKKDKKKGSGSSSD